MKCSYIFRVEEGGMLRSILCCVSLLAFAGAVFAADFQGVPEYRTKRWCKEVANVSGDSKVIYDGCVRHEQSARDELMGSWSTLPIKTQRWCDEVAKASGPGSYSLLKYCVGEETASPEGATGHK
ncbi:hypothetical protein [Bradyrhizobium sp. ARR65]|uniref:hypothetical protein n=1 Tax=Bradyrhizobium sp. ARR65 TaxID=1040989 RepID=UPI000687521E|nr:hypothetical protein [Bradyrhizobium sp. ARR65]